LSPAASNEYIIASYYLETGPDADPYKIAKKFATGQTIGTWIDVPGLSYDARRRYEGQVVDIIGCPPYDVAFGDRPKQAHIIRIGFPAENFGRSFASLLTTLLGNDASTSIQAKLVGIDFPDSYLARFPGPQFGIDGVRKAVGVERRPILLNMIKPCLGFTPEQGAEFFYKTAVGGVDIIKDDELLTNPDYCPVAERAKAYVEARRRAYEETGHRAAYFVNVTDRVPDIFDNAKRVVELGADGIMVNFMFAGLDVLAALAQDPDIPVPVLAHYAGTGLAIESPASGIDSVVLLGKLARLAGADIALYNTPYGGYPFLRSKYLLMKEAHARPWGTVTPTLSAVGGGVTPATVPTLVSELGNDIVIGAGGAIQGHPMGPKAGVQAMLAAIEASVDGVSLDEKAKDCEPLRLALDLWR